MFLLGVITEIVFCLPGQEWCNQKQRHFYLSKSRLEKVLIGAKFLLDMGKIGKEVG